MPFDGVPCDYTQENGDECPNEAIAGAPDMNDDGFMYFACSAHKSLLPTQ